MNELTTIETAAKTEGSAVVTDYKAIIATRTGDILIALIVAGSFWLGHVL